MLRWLTLARLDGAVHGDAGRARCKQSQVVRVARKDPASSRVDRGGYDEGVDRLVGRRGAQQTSRSARGRFIGCGNRVDSGDDAVHGGVPWPCPRMVSATTTAGMKTSAPT